MSEIEVRSINGRELSDNYSRNQLLNKIDKSKINDNGTGADELWSASKTNAQFNTVVIELQQKSMLTNKQIKIMNSIGDEYGLDIATFGKQGLDGDLLVINNRLHNYNDGTQFQMDNVGDGVMFIFRQSNNPSRRLDKPSNYVGNGTFFQFQRAKDDGTGAMKSTEYLLEITKDADFLWRKNRPVLMTTTKSEDNLYAFTMQPQFEHQKILSLNYKLNTPLFEIKKINNMASLISGASLSNGLNIQSITGDINIISNGKILVSESGITARLLTATKGANFPTTDLFEGKFFKNTYTGKFYLYNATTNKWELINTSEVS